MNKRKSIQVDEVEWETAKRLALQHRVSVKTIVGMAIQTFAAGQWRSIDLPHPGPLTPERERAIKDALGLIHPQERIEIDESDTRRIEPDEYSQAPPRKRRP